MLAALQRGIPLHRRPFAELARTARCTEAALLERLAAARAEGTVRRFGAVFDARRLGYRSALCAVAVPREEADAAAAKVVPFGAVTHCYLRETRVPEPGAPNLWFTLSAPAEEFRAVSGRVAAALAPYAPSVLPAVRRFKIDVVFGAAARERDESVADALPPPTEEERRIVRAMQGDTEARPDYFAALAERVGMKEWDLLSRLEMWRRSGRLRRIGLLLRHRAAGFTANGMCCWRVDGDTTAAGRALAASPHVTHCYERPESPAFPRNLYAMIHCRAPDEAEARFAELSALPELAAAENAAMLISTREYKKTSMTFFEGDDV